MIERDTDGGGTQPQSRKLIIIENKRTLSWLRTLAIDLLSRGAYFELMQAGLHNALLSSIHIIASSDSGDIFSDISCVVVSSEARV